MGRVVVVRKERRRKLGCGMKKDESRIAGPKNPTGAEIGRQSESVL